MDWGAHLLVNLAFAVAGAAIRAEAVPRWQDVLTYFWPMAASNLIDVDHLLADPIYDPDRCSIGFHPLHSWTAGILYSAGMLWSKTRLFAIGAITHLGLDAIDCVA